LQQPCCAAEQRNHAQQNQPCRQRQAEDAAVGPAPSWLAPTGSPRDARAARPARPRGRRSAGHRARRRPNWRRTRDQACGTPGRDAGHQKGHQSRQQQAEQHRCEFFGQHDGLQGWNVGRRRSSGEPRQGGRAEVEAEAENGVAGQASQAVLQRRRGAG
jgi:hypothetical protein